MKCEECQSLIEEYFDRELNSRREVTVAAHLAGCTACTATLEELRQQHSIYSRYDREVEVSPNLWAGIETRIRIDKAAMETAPPVPGWRKWLNGMFAAPHISPAFAVALVVIAIGATVAVMSYMHSRNGSGQGPVAVVAPLNPGEENTGTTKSGDGEQKPLVTPKPPEKVVQKVPKTPAAEKQQLAGVPKRQAPPDPMKLVREAEQKYLAAIAILSQDVNRQRSQIDPAVLARFDTALYEIDRTIEETRQIVHRNPSDPVALQYLLSAYAKKVDTLRAMTMD
jgi:hypothetical protein